MASAVPRIEFYDGITESLSDVSLRRDRTGSYVIVFSFEELKALERFNSYTHQFNKTLRLRDEEGDINLTPSSLQIIYGGFDGDDLERVDCRIHIERADHWERLMRFMHRYAEANGMEYGERK